VELDSSQARRRALAKLHNQVKTLLLEELLGNLRPFTPANYSRGCGTTDSRGSRVSVNLRFAWTFVAPLVITLFGFGATLYLLKLP
jgi:hypothetical protein